MKKKSNSQYWLLDFFCSAELHKYKSITLKFSTKKDEKTKKYIKIAKI